MIKPKLNQELKDELKTLKNDEVFNLSIGDRKFIILNSEEYEKIYIGSKAFLLINKMMSKGAFK